MFRKALIASLIALAFAHAASAQNVVLYRESDRVDPRDVARILGKADTPPAGIKLRSIKLLDEPSVAEAKPRPAALALPVQFAFDSAEILPRARAQLDALAEGIKMIDPSQKVVIEGHTDAVGSEQYNLVLSQRRAMSVKRYLVVVHGIDEARLKPLGFGEFQPFNENDPNSPENRRVQFRGG